MKKIVFLVSMILTICAHCLAAGSEVSEIAPDYQTVLGGQNAVVELADKRVMAAVANLKIYDKMNAVILPKGLENYMVIRAGKAGRAFHFGILQQRGYRSGYAGPQ